MYPDCIRASERYDHICSQYITFKYVRKNGKFEKETEDYYEYYLYSDIRTKQEIVLHAEKDLNSMPFTIDKDQKVEVLGGDVSEWILIRDAKTGEEGWLYVKECKCMLPDGSMAYSDEVFDGLAWFG